MGTEGMISQCLLNTILVGEDEKILKTNDAAGWYNNLNVPDATELYT